MSAPAEEWTVGEVALTVTFTVVSSDGGTTADLNGHERINRVQALVLLESLVAALRETTTAEEPT